MSRERMYRRGSMWYADYEEDGQRIRESLHTDDEKIAARRFAMRIRQSVPPALTDLIAQQASTIPLQWGAFTNQHVRAMRGPLVYVYLQEGRIKYVGMSSCGISRAFAPTHHVLSKIIPGDTDAILYCSVKTKDEAENVEAYLIEILRPELNGRRPIHTTNENLMTMRRAVESLEGLTSPLLEGNV